MSRNAVSLPTARIVLVGLSGLLRDIVREILVTERDIWVVEELSGPASLPAVLNRMSVDLVIWNAANGGLEPDVRERCIGLLRAHPRTAVLTVEGNGRRGMLCQLKPRVVPLGELSPALLLQTIRKAVRP